MIDFIDKKIITEIAGDIEISKDLFKSIAQKLNITIEELLERLKVMKEKGYIKRIAPIIKHRNTEYNFNGLATFNVNEDKKEQLIDLLKSIQSISHVYERQTNEKWPYCIYGMTHGRSKEEVESTISEIIEQVGIIDYKIMYSSKEFKKTSPNMNYLL